VHKEIADQKYILRVFTYFYGAAQKSVSGQQLPQILPSSNSRFFLAKHEIKMIRRGHYSSNNFQDSTKRKSTKKKTLGYLPRVLFFNAFELGAEKWKSCIFK
jgi:hypothetical protein